MQKIGTRARRKSALITLSCLQNFFFKEKLHKITRVTFQIDTKGHFSSAKKNSDNFSWYKSLHV